MKRHSTYAFILMLTLGLWACGKKDPDPQAQFPGYLRIPATLTGYAGSGRIAIEGDLALNAEGPETLNSTTKTYTGVLGKIVQEDITANFTLGQPRIYAESYAVPAEYESNGKLSVINAITVGAYPMGFETKPTPTGAQADIILNLPGPQLYTARSGSLTISESSLIKSEGQNRLYRIQGSFRTSLLGSGTGATASAITGTFDLLLLAN
jgi:hypothetical protein